LKDIKETFSGETKIVIGCQQLLRDSLTRLGSFRMIFIGFSYWAGHDFKGIVEVEDEAVPSAAEDKDVVLQQEEAAEITEKTEISTGVAASTTRTLQSGAVAATRIIGPGPINLTMCSRPL
jgi:hypothetical protein